MKIFDGLKLKDRKVEIPDTDRGDLPAFFKELGFDVGAEIGVWRGDYTKQLTAPGIHIYGIDPCLQYPDYTDTHGKLQYKLDALYEQTKENVKGLDVTLIRKTSMEAVKDFKDASLDFVYIDGSHVFKYVAEDIWEWSKKVKKGGIISGHDYGLPADKRSHNSPTTLHVRYVVDAYVKALDIHPLYVLGRNEKIPGEKRDTWRSWFWFNL